jgi:integrase/recombinase XerD
MPFPPNKIYLAPDLEDVLCLYKDYLQVELRNAVLTTSLKIRTVRTFLNQTPVSNFGELAENDFMEFYYSNSKEQGWSVHTQLNYWKNLKCFFDWAISRGFVNFPENPVLKIKRPKMPRVRPRRLSMSQLEKIFTVCCTYPWQYEIQRARNVAIVAVFMYTGMRLNELLNLRPEDICHRRNTILIRMGKGGKVRIVKMSVELKRFLRDFDQHCARLEVRSTYYFFTIGKKKQMTAKDIYRFIKKIREQTGMHFTPHQFRHSWASICKEQRVPISFISSAMGHESILYTQGYLAPEQKIVLDFFSHFSPWSHKSA